MGSRVRVLSFHSGYRCRHAGACCASDWPIPIEPDRRGPIGRLLGRSPGPALLPFEAGRCVFHRHEAGAGRRCEVHAALGHDALPLACRQFPRVSLIDPRGASVTLSHYCPTAAGLLDRAPDAPAEILTNAAAFPDDGEYDGLDARDALPPLLRRDMLMDWDAWWTFERLAVGLIGGGEDPPAALARLRGIVRDVTAWTPADGPLVERVRSAFADATLPPPRTQLSGPDPSALLDAVLQSVPAAVPRARFPAQPHPAARTVGRFLAAHAFANWTIHLGGDLRAWLRSIEAAQALLTAGAGVRHADLLLRHLADPRRLASALG